MRRIIVFGTGAFYKSQENRIKETYEIAAFLDNGVPAGMPGSYPDSQIKIYNPCDTDMIQEYPILIMVRKFYDICRQLMEMKVPEGNIKIGLQEYPDSRQEKLVFSSGERILLKNGTISFHTMQKDFDIGSQEEFDRMVAEYYSQKEKRENPYIDLIADMPVMPLNRTFGWERGRPVDRYYIEKFLEDNRELIGGDVLEIAENTYTMQFGEERVRNSYILHIEGWGENAIKGNLETGEGIETEKFDTAIITQTLMFTYGIGQVAHNIYKMLKRGGRAFITVAGISQISRYDADEWDSYFAFHEDAMRKLFVPLFGEENVDVQTHGNMKTAIALLYGLSYEDLKPKDFEVVDKDYPVIITTALYKR